MISTLKEVREALDDACGGRCNAEYNPCWQRQAIDQLDALIAATEKAEPVAWAMRRADGLVLDVICPDEHDSHEGEYTLPLYTAPQSAPSTSTAMTDDAVTPEYLAWLASLQPPRNGVGGNEAWNAGVAFAGQQLAPQSAAKP